MIIAERNETNRKRVMKMQRLLLCVGTAVAIFFLCLPVLASAQEGSETSGFSVVLSEEEGCPGDVVEVLLRYDGSLGKAGAFLAEVGFDPSCAEFDGAALPDGEPEGYITTAQTDGTIRSVYSAQPDAAESGLTISYRYQIPKTAMGTAEFSVRITQRVTGALTQEEAMEFHLSYQIVQPASSEAYILSLIPSSGELSPPFSPEVTEYETIVPYSVTSLTFAARASKGARVFIDRKNLGAGGSDTVFKLTVTSEDGTAKRIYSVKAHREEKPAATPKPSPTPRPTGTPKPTVTPRPAQATKPTATPKPTKTPKPTATPKPAQTPKPTATPKPTKTPKPSPTPKAKATARPVAMLSATAKPNRSPSPDVENEYLTEVITVEEEQFAGNSSLVWRLAVCAGAVVAGILVLLTILRQDRRHKNKK